MALGTLTPEQQIQLLYVAYFGRAGDPEGLGLWLAAINAGVPLNAIAANFAHSQEAIDEYSFLSTPNLASPEVRAAFVNQIYQNLFGRDAEPAGLAFWTGRLAAIQNQGQAAVEAGVSDFIRTIALSAAGSDADSVLAKVAVASYLTNELIEHNQPYTADANLVAHEVLAQTTSLGDVPAAKQIIDNFIEFGLGQTFDLTPQTDIFTGNGADDVFNAQAEQTAFLPLQTLNNSDKLDGGGGHDVLNAQLVTSLVTPALLAAIQEIQFTQAPGIAANVLANLVIPTLNAVNADSIDTLGFSGFDHSMAVENIRTALTTVELNNYNGNNLFGDDNAVFLDFTGAALDGATDELALLVNNVGEFDGDEVTLDIDTDSGAATAGYETLNIESISGVANHIHVVGSAIEDTVANVVVTGDTDLAINDFFDSAWDAAVVDLIDASGLEAGIRTWVLGTGAVEVRGGSGDDDVSFGDQVAANAFGNDGDDVFTFFDAENGGNPDKSSFTKADHVDGGAGFDEIVIEAQGGALLTAGVGAGIVNVERIVHDVLFGSELVEGAISVNMAESGSANELELAAEYDGNNVTVTNLLNADKVFFTGDHINDLTLAHAAEPGILDSVYLDMADPADIDGALIVASNVSALLLNISGTEGWTNRIEEANQIDTDIQITGGPNTLVLGGADEADYYDHDGGLIDAGAFTGDLITGLGEGNQTLLSGTGNDIIADGVGGDTYSAFNDNDLIDISTGGSDIVQFNDTFSNGASNNLVNSGAWHQVEGFAVADDKVAVQNDVNGNDFITTTGQTVPVGETEFLNLTSIVTGVVNGNAQPSEMIKFGFGIETAGDVMHFNGLGAGEAWNELFGVPGGNNNFISVGNNSDIGSYVLTMFYDTSNNEAWLVAAQVHDVAGPGVVSGIDAQSNVTVITGIEMSFADYQNFAPSNLLFGDQFP